MEVGRRVRFTRVFVARMERIVGPGEELKEIEAMRGEVLFLGLGPDRNIARVRWSEKPSLCPVESDVMEALLELDE